MKKLKISEITIHSIHRSYNILILSELNADLSRIKWPNDMIYGRFNNNYFLLMKSNNVIERIFYNKINLHYKLLELL